MFKEVQKEISSNSRYPTHINQSINHISLTLTHIPKYLFLHSYYGRQFGVEINNRYTKLVQSGDAEKFCESYYSKIITNSQNWIENFDKSVAALAFKKLGDKIFHFSQNPQKTFNSTEIQPITDKEKDGLQYLSGYAERKFLKKIKRKCNSTDNQNPISILEHFISDNPQTQQLITTKTRGGLIDVKDKLLNVFTITEETFRKKTVNIPHSIDLNAITSYFLKDSVITSIYNNLVEESGVKLATELK